MRFPHWAVLFATAGLSGCYLSHLAGGQIDLLSRRQPIHELLADSATDQTLRRQLELVRQARRFSVQRLRLPDNPSYSEYADLKRRFVVWNVLATPEFSLEPVTSCFVWLGCLAYRGYFDQALAREHALTLAAEGLDVYVGGVAAYSTLGWFDDPVLSSMLHWDDDRHGRRKCGERQDAEAADRLVETLFHELAHQQLFVAGDTAFNESFASFVGEEGLRQFRAARGEPPLDRAAARRERQFLEVLQAARKRLETLYAQPLTTQAMRKAKQGEFKRLRRSYAALKKKWKGDAGYDGWFAGELNNARLLPVGLYQQRVPEFAALFREAGGDWARFYESARTLAKN